MDGSRECAPAPQDEAVTRIEQIADAALRRFARYGFKRSSMDDIAREAGLAKATIYLHFKGKDDVFRAMIARFTAQVAARCEAVMAQPLPFPVKLAALMLAHFGAGYAAFGDGDAVSCGLGANVHHMGLALSVEVGERRHAWVYFLARASELNRGRRGSCWWLSRSFTCM